MTISLKCLYENHTQIEKSMQSYEGSSIWDRRMVWTRVSMLDDQWTKMYHIHHINHSIIALNLLFKDPNWNIIYRNTGHNSRLDGQTPAYNSHYDAILRKCFLKKEYRRRWEKEKMCYVLVISKPKTCTSVLSINGLNIPIKI